VRLSHQDVTIAILVMAPKCQYQELTRFRFMRLSVARRAKENRSGLAVERIQNLVIEKQTGVVQLCYQRL
jgi:hypothetical protein